MAQRKKSKRSKGVRINIMMVSTAQHPRFESRQTGYFKTMTVNPRNEENVKLELKMYDPVVRKHVIFKQKKISK